MQEDSQSQPHKRNPKSYGSERRRVNLLMILLVSLVLIAILPFFKVTQILQGKTWVGESKTQNIEVVSVRPSIFIEKDFDSPPLFSFQENTLFSISELFLAKSEEPIKPVRKKIEVVITAYSSTPWETDDTPYITAAGTWVREGIVAANFLSFGTEIKIPEIYGEKIFVVQDRMHPRNYYHVDIWFPSHWEALNFGIRRAHIEVLGG